MQRMPFFFMILMTFTMMNGNWVYSQETHQIKGELQIPDSSHVQIIKTHDGATNIGRIVDIGDQEVQFKTSLGLMTIQINKIKEIRLVSSKQVKKGGYWFPNPNNTRLYFAPTARMLEKGEGYFADYYIFFPSVAVGLTDHITIGGGMSLLPDVDMDEQIYFFTPKVGLKATEKVHVAAGALLIKIPDLDDEEDEPTVGILYGVITFGTMDASFTAGLGYGFVDDEFADKPMVVLGGEKRISRRLSFVSENWILPGLDDALISYGVRFFGEKMSVDLALVNVLNEDAVFPGIPYIDFVFNF